MNQKDHVKCEGCGCQTPALTCYIGKFGLLCDGCAGREKNGFILRKMPVTNMPYWTWINADDDGVPETKRSIQPTGFNCSCCNSRNDYAESNQPNGTYLCYECR